MQVENIPPLVESNDILDDPAALNERWEADGYLFFRDVIDHGAIATLRAQYLERLKDQRMVESLTAPPVWTGVPSKEPKPIERMDESSWRGLVEHPSFHRLMAGILGESFSWVPIVSYRAKVPTSTPASDTFYGRHQDGYFNEGIDFRICWVPLMDIGADLGGLTIAPGSHKWGPLHDDDAPPLYEIPQGRIDDSAWRRSDYKVGDVLIFHNLVVHAALDNVSEMLRLSIDVRAVPASSPQPIVGRVVDFLDETLTVDTRNGVRRVQMNGDTYVRGIGNARLRREEWDTVLRSGNEIIAALDDDGAPTVVRSGV